MDNELLYSCDIAGSIMKWNWRLAKSAFADDTASSPPVLRALSFKQKAHADNVNGIALHPARDKLLSCSKEIKASCVFML